MINLNIVIFVSLNLYLPTFVTTANNKNKNKMTQE